MRIKLQKGDLSLKNFPKAVEFINNLNFNLAYVDEDKLLRIRKGEQSPDLIDYIRSVHKPYKWASLDLEQRRDFSILIGKDLFENQSTLKIENDKAFINLIFSRK